MGARVVKQFKVGKRQDTYHDNLIDIELNEEVNRYRKDIKVKVNQIIKKIHRNDVYCSVCTNPRKQGNNILNVLGTFKRDISEIKLAIGGNVLFLDNKQRYTYEKSFIVMLISKQSKRSVSVAIVVEHKRPRNKKVFEIVWFATKDRKRNQKYGQLLFQLIIDFACELNINKIIVTAASAAVCWWYHIGTKIKENCHLEKDHVYTKLTQSDVFQALLQSSVENGDLSDADSQRRRKRIQRIQKDFSKLKLNEKPTKNHDLHFYYDEKTPFIGEPYRHGISKTFHLWYSIKK